MGGCFQLGKSGSDVLETVCIVRRAEWGTERRVVFACFLLVSNET